MAKGGAGPRLKGDAFERAVVLDLERHGWEAMRLRQGGGEDIDIIAIQACRNGYADHHWNQPHVRFIQCKLNAISMTKAAKEALYLRAESVNAHGYLVYKRDGQIVYEELRE